MRKYKMRYLNKIVFINSATIPYAEIQLDGNVHFIGTQGVGKSTVLRAILYFYNADSRKLGIPKGPTVKNFADWYLGFGNSYIVFEVARETGAYCVMAFKSQNRVCFRFFDAPYCSEYFVNDTNKAKSWEAIRQSLDARRVNVSSMVNSYDQYRDILYGNFLGKKEFKKYALLETKQYKNIYRTIQNVFLNTKLDADEIKHTIISSIEDENITIDLDQYSHHLKGFETELKDIKLFRYPSVQKQADTALEKLSAIRHINREHIRLSGELNARRETIENEKPELHENKLRQEELLNARNQKLKYESELFGKRKQNHNGRISELNGKIKESNKKKKYYDGINIHDLIARVAANEEKKLELDSLKKERDLLTNKSVDVKHKYEALIKEQEQLLDAFRNQNEKQKIVLEREENRFVDKLNKDYEKLFRMLEQEHEAELRSLDNELSFKTNEVNGKEKEKITINLSRFYEKEIGQMQKTIDDSELLRKEENNSIISHKQQISALQTKWDFEIKEAERISERKKEKIHRELERDESKKREIENNIEKSKNSLYGWLNSNKPGWENNIGKVIDEKLLFQDGFSPRLQVDSKSFYGIDIDLNEIDRKVKTIEDYRFELEKLSADMEKCREDLRQADADLEKEKENIQRRNLPKIKELKENIRQAEYHIEQLTKQIGRATVEKKSWEEKAVADKKEALRKIQIELDHAIVLKQDAAKNFEDCKAKLRKSKENKQREKTRRINEFQSENKSRIADLEKQLADKRNHIASKIDGLRIQRNNELNKNGVDTGHLTEIEKHIAAVEIDLDFIEKKRDKVVEYQKDKRELFDKEKSFKNEIESLNKKLNQLESEYSVLRASILKEIEDIDKTISRINDTISCFETDEKKFEDFKLSSAFKVYDKNQAVSGGEDCNRTAVQIIDEITEKYYAAIEKQDELKASIDKFLSYFSEENIFKFPAKLIETQDYIRWTEDLSEFIEEGKIVEYEKRTNERFADIIRSVGKETTLLISKTGEIKKIINKINADFRQKNFVEAVTNIELDIRDSKNTSVTLLKKIKEFNDDNAIGLGAANLFTNDNHDKNNQKAIELLKQLVKEISYTRNSVIQLTDSFELAFRVEENGNDTGWVEKLTNVGSEGTDVLVKAMINIMLLNVFKEGASRKFKDFKLHCMMDEVGKLHPNNVKGILKFANERNILLINGSPTESTPLNYRHIYKIHKDEKKQSKVKRIISNPLLVG